MFLSELCNYFCPHFFSSVNWCFACPPTWGAGPMVIDTETGSEESADREVEQEEGGSGVDGMGLQVWFVAQVVFHFDVSFPIAVLPTQI